MCFLILFLGHVEVVKGEWVYGISAGGSRNNLVDFAMNPQFVLSLSEPGILNIRDTVLVILLKFYPLCRLPFAEQHIGITIHSLALSYVLHLA